MRLIRDPHLNLSELSETECEEILKVIQRDFHLRQQEKQRLGKLEEDVLTADSRSTLLCEEKSFNENCCIRCFCRFFFLFNNKFLCSHCAHNVCKRCCDYDPESRQYICKVCQKQRELKLQSCDWFYADVMHKFKRFGSAKILRAIFKRKTESDSENDSGYDPASRSNSLPAGKKRTRPSLDAVFNLGGHLATDVIEEETSTSECANLPSVDAASRPYDTPYTCPVSTGRADFEEVTATQLSLFRQQLADTGRRLSDTLQARPAADCSQRERDAHEETLRRHHQDISRQLASLQQTLHIAVDNLHPTESGSSRTTHDLVNDIVYKEVATFIGSPLPPDRTIVADQSETAGADQSETNGVDQSERASYDDVLAVSIIDRMMSDAGRRGDGDEEAAEEAAEAESRVRRSFTRLSNRATIEQLTGLLEADARTASAAGARQVMLQSVESGVYTDDQRTADDDLGDDDDDLDSLVLRNLPQKAGSSDSEVFSRSPATKSLSGSSRGNDSDDTLAEEEEREEEEAEEEEEEEDGFLSVSHLRQHSVPLPSFEGSDVGGQEDLDDITSHAGDDWDDDNWSMSTSGLFSDISAYDNLGHKAIGRDGSTGGAVLMLIPDSVKCPRVGDREVDDLSDLSENETKSDISLDDSEDERPPPPPPMTDTAIQTERPPPPVTVTVATSVPPPPPPEVEEVSVPAAPPLISSEADEVDPKFVRRPHNVKCFEGEMVRLECEVTGTQPVDIFWYKDTAEVLQLDDDERCNISVKGGRCVVEMYNLTKKDAGQYLCIGVNEMGKCSQSIQVLIEANSEEFEAPEMLRSLLGLESVVGRRAKFQCKVSGYPTPMVTWYKDHKRIKPSDKYTIEKSGNRDYILLIEDIDLEDDCEIRVIAKNLAGEVRSRAQLIVDATTSLTDNDEPSRAQVGTEGSSTGSLAGSRSDDLYPDTSQLLQLAQQVAATRGQITDSAENLLQSADEMSSMHRHLDTMDGRLLSLEEDVCMSYKGGANDDNNNQNDDSRTDADNNNYAELLLRDGDRQQSAVGAVTRLTSDALAVLSSANQVVETERVARGLRRRSEPVAAAVTAAVTEASTPRSTRRSTHLLDMTVFPDTVDCGLQPVSSSRYNRDFVVSGEGKRRAWTWQRKTQSTGGAEEAKKTGARGRKSLDERPHQWDDEGQEPVRSPLGSHRIYDSRESLSSTDTEGNVYLAASDVFSLEERITQLRSRVEATHKDTSCPQMAALEQEVCRTAAQVEQSSRKVSSVEDAVTRSLSASDEADEEGVVSLTGADREDALPASRTESDDSLAIPSVRKLIDKYAAFSPEGSGVRRVYSLTERSLPRAVRETLKQQYPAALCSANVRGASPADDARGRRRRLEDLFSEDEPSTDSLKETDQCTTKHQRTGDNTARQPTDDDTARQPTADNTARQPTDDNTDRQPTDDKTARQPTDDNTARQPTDDNTARQLTDDDTARQPTDDDTARQLTDDNTARQLTDDNTARQLTDDNTARQPTDDDTAKQLTDDNTARQLTDDNMARQPTDDNMARQLTDDDTARQPTDDDTARQLTDDNTARQPTDDDTARQLTDDNTARQPTDDSTQQTGGANGGSVSHIKLRSSQHLRHTDIDLMPSPPAGQPGNKQTRRADIDLVSSPSAGQAPSKKAKRNSTIMARAAFWDTRIDQGEICDDNTSMEFPEMPDDSFKCEEDEVF